LVAEQIDNQHVPPDPIGAPALAPVNGHSNGQLMGKAAGKHPHELTQQQIDRVAVRAMLKLDGTQPPADAEAIAQQQQELLRSLRPANHLLLPPAGTPIYGREGVTPGLAARTPPGPRVKFRIINNDEPEGNEQAILRRPGFQAPEQLDPKKPAAGSEAWQKEMLQRAYAEQSLTLEDLLPHRIRVAWRIVRELGRIKGLVGAEEPLCDALKPNSLCLDPWQIPVAPWVQPRSPNSQQPGFNLLKTILDAEEIAEDLQYHRFDFETSTWKAYPGLALLPPPVPIRWWDDQCEIRPDYEPDEDKALALYVRAVELVTKALYVEQGSDHDPDQGRYGLTGLLDAETIRLAFPTRLQILTWEELITEEAMDLLIDTSVQKTRKILKQRYGLQAHEITTVLRLAIRLAQLQTSADPEENRSVMVMRLEDYVRRSRDSMDMRSEMQGLKQMSIVQGLGNEDKQDLFTGMIDAVRNVANERRSQMMEPRKQVENTSTA
jgi:hypothetical protein